MSALAMIVLCVPISLALLWALVELLSVAGPKRPPAGWDRSPEWTGFSDGTYGDDDAGDDDARAEGNQR